LFAVRRIVRPDNAEAFLRGLSPALAHERVWL
jgi:hypothetical protein